MVDRIKQLLEWQHLTPTQFADRIGIGRPVVSHILSERNKPSLDVVQRIIAAFPELSLPWLLSGIGDMLAATGPAVSSGLPGAAPAAGPSAAPAAEAVLPLPPAVPTAPPIPATLAPTVLPPAPVATAPAQMTPARVPAAAVAPAIPAFRVAGRGATTEKPALAVPPVPPRFRPVGAAPSGPARSAAETTAATTAATSSVNTRVGLEPAGGAAGTTADTPGLAGPKPAVAAEPAAADLVAPGQIGNPGPTDTDSAVAAGALPGKPERGAGPSDAAGLAGALVAGLGEPGKAIRRIVIFYRDGSFADYQPES